MKTFTIITIAIHLFLEPQKIKLIDTALVHRSFDTSWTVNRQPLITIQTGEMLMMCC